MPTHSAPGTFRTFLSKSDPCVPVPIIPNRTVSEAAGACAAQSTFGSSNVTVPPATPAMTDPAIRTKPRRVMPFMRAQTSWRTIAREFNGTTSCYGQQNRFASNKSRHQPNHFALHQRRGTVPRRLVIGCCGRSGAILGNRQRSNATPEWSFLLRQNHSLPCDRRPGLPALGWSMLDLPAAKEGKNQVYLNGKGSQHWLVVTSRYQEQS
jgi:hypothetical protein